MTLNELVETIETREDLAQFIQALLEDLRADPKAWENPELERYLDALASWTKSMDGYFKNVRGQPAPEQPTWRVVGYMLLAARIYE